MRNIADVSRLTRRMVYLGYPWFQPLDVGFWASIYGMVFLDCLRTNLKKWNRWNELFLFKQEFEESNFSKNSVVEFSSPFEKLSFVTPGKNDESKEIHDSVSSRGHATCLIRNSSSHWFIIDPSISSLTTLNSTLHFYFFLHFFILHHIPSAQTVLYKQNLHITHQTRQCICIPAERWRSTLASLSEAVLQPVMPRHSESYARFEAGRALMNIHEEHPWNLVWLNFHTGGTTLNPINYFWTIVVANNWNH